MNRIQYIDRLKGFAILLVVMGHVVVFCYHEGAETFGRFIGSFHMPLFMFLSGVVTKTNIASSILFRTWSRKIGALLLPFIVFGFCFTLYCTNTSNIINVPTKVWSFISSNSKMGYWYLFDLALFYALMPFYSLNKRNRWWIDVMIGVMIETLFYIGWKPENIFTDVMCLLNATSFYPFFILGYIIRKYEVVAWLQSRDWVFPLSLIAYVFMLAFPFEEHILHTFSWRLLMPVTGILTSLIFFANREKNDSWDENQLSFIGKHTLDVYVLHYFIISSINLTMVGKWLANTDNGFIATIFAIVISIPVVYLSIIAGFFLRESEFLRKYAFGEIFKKK